MTKAPIFQSIIGEAWDGLPLVLKRHYANRPYTDDVIIVEGVLDVMCNAPLKFFAPIIKLMGQVPPYTEKNVPVTVRFESDQHSNAYHFNRLFHFKDRKPYVFHSKILPLKDDTVIECMRFGLAFKMSCFWDGEKIVMKQRGYRLKLFGMFIPIPLTLILGEGYGEEIPVDDDHFDMMVSITHPWWGKIYEYKGRFKIVQETIDVRSSIV